eukprot:3631453-Pyramimonas_sp.AAC.2
MKRLLLLPRSLALLTSITRPVGAFVVNAQYSRVLEVRGGWKCAASHQPVHRMSSSSRCAFVTDVEARKRYAGATVLKTSEVQASDAYHACSTASTLVTN